MDIDPVLQRRRYVKRSVDKNSSSRIYAQFRAAVVSSVIMRSWTSLGAEQYPYTLTVKSDDTYELTETDAAMETHPQPSLEFSYDKLKGYGIRRVTYGSQAFIETAEDWPFVLKIFRDEYEDRIFSEDTIQAYFISQQYLGGLVPEFVFINLTSETHQPEIALIMRKVEMDNMAVQIQDLMSKGDIEGTKDLITRNIQVIVNFIRRGIFPIDSKFQNFGLESGRLMMLDPGYAMKGYGDGSLLNFQQNVTTNHNFLVHSLHLPELAVFYLNEIRRQGLNKEDIRSTLTKYFGIDAPIPVNDISQEINQSLGNKAMNTEEKGGIDLSSDKALIVHNNGQAIQFHIDPAQLQRLQNAPGFSPTIVSIKPLRNLRRFLGIN